MRNKASARARARASVKNLIFWSHVKKRPLALALALPKTSERGPLALALPSLGLTHVLGGCRFGRRKILLQ
jgi:hypothetical protein